MNRTKVQSRRRTRNRRGRSAPTYIPPGLTEYDGSVHINDKDTLLVNLMDNATVSASVGGAISAAFNNNPSAATNWTEYSTIYDEYRVVAIKFSYDPNNVVNTATLNGFNGYQSIVHGIASSPATLPGAASTGLAQRWNAFRPFVRTWKMADTIESVFVSTAAPTSSSNTLFIFATGATASNYYGNILIEYLVQFRSKRF